MKWLGLLVILALVPLTIALLSSGPAGRRQVGFLLGSIPFFTQSAHVIVAPISWAYWPGYTKGIELSVVDGIVVGILFTLGRNRAAANYLVPFLLLMACALVSAAGAAAPMAATFLVWQLARVCMVYFAAMRIGSDAPGMRAMIGGMIFGLGCNAVAAAVQSLGGIYQAPGLMAHQNTVGLMAHYVSLPAAALFVAERPARWALLGVAIAAVVAVLGASRATVGLEAGGLALLILVAVMFWPNSRSYALLGIGVLGMAVMAPIAYKALAPRFAAAEATNYDERAAFRNVAEAMMHDHPLGVGANHYVIVANVQGYSDRFHVAETPGSRSANVHNAYLLTGAEMGWAALIPFLWLTVLTAAHGLYWCFRSRDKRLAILLLGCASAQVVVAVHNLFEWIFVTYTVQVLFCLNLGLIASLVGQIQTARAGAADRSSRARQAELSGADPRLTASPGIAR